MRLGECKLAIVEIAAYHDRELQGGCAGRGRSLFTVQHLHRMELLGRRWPEPSGKCGEKAAFIGFVSHPCDVAVRSYEDGGGSSDRADYGKLPGANIFCVELLNPFRPPIDIDASGALEIEQQRSGSMQQ